MDCRWRMRCRQGIMNHSQAFLFWWTNCCAPSVWSFVFCFRSAFQICFTSLKINKIWHLTMHLRFSLVASRAAAEKKFLWDTAWLLILDLHKWISENIQNIYLLLVGRQELPTTKALWKSTCGQKIGGWLFFFPFLIHAAISLHFMALLQSHYEFMTVLAKKVVEVVVVWNGEVCKLF